MKVVIATPLYSDPKAGYTQSLAGMIYHTARNSEIELHYGQSSGSILPKNREALVETTSQAGADFILFIDGDQTFPEDTLLRLLAHNLDVVGCNIVLRSGDNGPSAYKGGRPVVSTKAGGVEQVDAVGLGVCLIAVSVFDKLKPPYFRYSLMDRGNGPELVGEDYGFCNSLMNAGIPAYVDHSLSMEVGHIAETVLRF